MCCFQRCWFKCKLLSVLCACVCVFFCMFHPAQRLEIARFRCCCTVCYSKICTPRHYAEKSHPRGTRNNEMQCKNRLVAKAHKVDTTTLGHWGWWGGGHQHTKQLTTWIEIRTRFTYTGMVDVVRRPLLQTSAAKRGFVGLATCVRRILLRPKYGPPLHD